MLKGSNKSYRKVVTLKEGSKRGTLYRNAMKTLGVSTKLEKCVKLPKGENLYEWYCVHLVDFYNKLNLIIGPCEYELAEKYKEKHMKIAGWEFFYQDKETNQYKKPKKVFAMDYIAMTIELIQKKLNDTKIFPVDGKFPKNIKKICASLFKRMFRIFAFLVIENSKIFEKKGLINHVNTVVKHFMIFIFEFNILDKEILLPMNDWVIINLEKHAGKLKVSKKELKEKKKKKETKETK